MLIQPGLNPSQRRMKRTGPGAAMSTWSQTNVKSITDGYWSLISRQTHQVSCLFSHQPSMLNVLRFLLLRLRDCYNVPFERLTVQDRNHFRSGLKQVHHLYTFVSFVVRDNIYGIRKQMATISTDERSPLHVDQTTDPAFTTFYQKHIMMKSHSDIAGQANIFDILLFVAYGGTVHC